MKRTLLGIFILLFTFSFGFSQTFVAEDFEGGSIPGDWNVITNASDGGWLVGNAATLGSQFWQIPENGTTFTATNDDGCNCDKSRDILVLPSVDLSGAGKAFLKFDMIFAGGTYGGATETAFVEVSYDGGTTWEVVQEIDGTGSLAWTEMLVDVSSVTGNADVTLGFRYNDGGGWLFGFALDNIDLSVPPINDMAFEYAAPYRFGAVGDTVLITGIVQNLGQNNLTSFDFTWDGGSGPQTEPITGLDIPSLSQDTFTHSVPFIFASPDNFNVSISVGNPNGVADPDMSNNSSSFVATGVMDPPAKKFFIEEATGTWCPWCPRGDVFMKVLEENHPETFVGVAVHVGQQTWPDPMELPGYAQDFNQLVGGYPTVQLDRVFNLSIPGPPTGPLSDMADFGVTIEEFSNSRTAPFSVDVTSAIDGPTRTLTADVAVTFHSNMDFTNFGVAALITEDGINVDEFAYRQANAYAGGGNGILEGYEALPNPIPGADITYNLTLREALGGFSGMKGIIPSDVEVGMTYTNIFTYDVPAEYDINNLNVAAIVVDRNNNGIVYNSAVDREPNLTTSIKDDLLEEGTVRVYPNPISDFATVEIRLAESSNVSIELINSMGQLVAAKNFGSLNGSVKLPLEVTDLNNGIYYVHVKVNDKISTQKVTIAN